MKLTKRKRNFLSLRINIYIKESMFQEYQKYRDMLYDHYSDKYYGFVQMINNSEIEDFNHECYKIDEDKEDHERSSIKSE